MARDGVQTRAQRKKREDNGNPASPIQMLPLERPRKPRVRKATAAPVTIPQTAPAAASGSETDRAEESSQDQDSGHVQNSDTDVVTDIQDTQYTQYTEDTQGTQDTQYTQDAQYTQDIQDTQDTQGTQDTQEPVDPLEPIDSETTTSSLTLDQVSLNAPSSASAAQSGSPFNTTQPSLNAQSSALAVQSGSSSAATPVINAQSSAPTKQSVSQSTAALDPALQESNVIDFTQDAGVEAIVDSSFSDFGSPPVMPLAPRSKLWARRPKTLGSFTFTLKRTPQPEKYALLHLWTDASMAALEATRPDSDPTLAVAVPMARFAQFLRSLAKEFPGDNSPKGQKLTVSTATQTIASGGKKRKATDDADDTPPRRRVRFQEQDTSVQTNTHRVVRYKPAPLYDADGMLQLGEPDIPVYSDEEDAYPQARPSLKKNKVVQTTAQQIETAPASEAVIDTVPETPRSRWGLGSIFSSASKFVPGLGRRTAPTAAIQRPVTATSRVNSTPQVLRPQHPRTEPRNKTRAASTQDVNALSDQDTPATEQAPPKRRKSKTIQPAQSHKVSKTQILPEREYRRARLLREKAEAAMTEEAKAERRKAQLGEIKEKKRHLEMDEKKIEDEITREESEAALKALNDWRDEKKANPGLKRPRPPSPKVIPNPKGCSYGFDPRYFEQSDSEEESSPPSSPTRDRPRKSPRTEGVSSAVDAIEASKARAVSTQAVATHTTDAQPSAAQAHKAQIYTGAFFGDSTPTHQGGNVFGELAASSAALDKASAFKQAVAATTKAPKTPKSPPRMSDGRLITNLSGHFCVPEDDTDDENSELSSSPSPSVNKTVGTDFATLTKTAPGLPTLATSQLPSQLPVTTATPSDQNGVASSTPVFAAATEKAKAPAWSQPPPAPPSPSHATLPSFPTADASDSLNAARAKALKHAPKKPSTLRESTRLASSPQTATEEQAEVPAITFPTTRRKSTDEIIAEMEQDVASKPPPPLDEILNVLAERSPNGQVKVSCRFHPETFHVTNSSQSPFTTTAPFSGNKAPGSNDTPLVEPSQVPSVEISKVNHHPPTAPQTPQANPSQVLPVDASSFTFSAPLPSPTDRDETPVNYYGLQAPTWQARYVDENWTPEMTAACDFTDDFEAFCATAGIAPYRIDDLAVNFTQEDADAVDLTDDFYDYCRQEGISPTVYSSAAS